MAAYLFHMFFQQTMSFRPKRFTVANVTPPGHTMDLFSQLMPLDDGGKRAVSAFLASCSRPMAHRYPFGNPVSAETCHVDIIRQCEYVVADKSDGVRACFVACREGNMCYAALCDRTGKMYGLQVQADAAFFQGTVLDTEVVRTGTGSYRVVVFDTCALAGNRDVEYAPLLTRLEYVRASFLPHVSFVGCPIAFAVKPMFLLTDKAGLDAYVSGLDHPTDGYILTPNQQPTSVPGTAAAIFKLKTCHTIDFLWSGGMLWYGDDKELFPITELHLNFQPSQLEPVRNGTVVEMSPQKDKAGMVAMLHFLQERPDKDTPNSYVTVIRTLQSIRDNITLEALRT